MTIRVLIVDDHAVVRQGLRSLLETRGEVEVVGEAEDGVEAVECARQMQPDVVLMDLLMPGMNGIEATARIRTAGLRTSVLILTSSIEDQLVKEAVRAGADGYVLKASRVGDLVQAIVRVSQGQRVLDPAVTQALFRHVQAPNPLTMLSAREREVFEELVRGRTNGEIGTNLCISEATVRTHIASILDKLGVRDRTQVTIYALKQGLVRLEELP